MNENEELTFSELGMLDDGDPGRFLRLVAAWQNFVHELDGYDYSIYDYDNDVDVRSILGSMIDKCPEAVQHKALHRLAAADRVFCEATEPAPRSNYPEEDWHSRMPRDAGPALRSDVDNT